MCCEKDEKLGPEKKSIFLNLLPVAYPLEERKQETVFRMMGAEKQIRQQTLKRARKLGQFIPNTEEECYCSTFLKKIQVLGSRKSKVKTRKLRVEAIESIEALIKEAIEHGKSTDKKISSATRVKWFRVVGYLFQVLRSVMKEYDDNQIRAELDRLKRVIADELKKRDQGSE